MTNIATPAKFDPIDLKRLPEPTATVWTFDLDGDGKPDFAVRVDFAHHRVDRQGQGSEHRRGEQGVPQDARRHLMAALSFLGARGNFRNLVKIGGATPTGGLPVLAMAGGAVRRGARAGAGVAIGAGPGPGAFGVGGTMMVKHEADANGSDGAQTPPPEADASQARARLEPHLGKISPEAARELGRLSRLDQVLLDQLAKRGGAVVEQLGALLAKVPSWSESARLGLVKLAASDSAEAVRLFGKVSQHSHIEGLNGWGPACQPPGEATVAATRSGAEPRQGDRAWPVPPGCRDGSEPLPGQAGDQRPATP